MTAPEVRRAFVAVTAPGEVLDAVERAVAPARRSMVGPRWAPREQWHLTLQFLGAVARLAPVAQGLAAVAAGTAPFPFRLGGAGAFPTVRRARVVWIGGADDSVELARLAGAVSTALAPAGYEPERRPFRPHLTVARLREPADVHPAVTAIGPDPIGPAWTVGEVVLFESRLSPRGSTYTVLGRYPLGR